MILFQEPGLTFMSVIVIALLNAISSVDLLQKAGWVGAVMMRMKRLTEVLRLLTRVFMLVHQDVDLAFKPPRMIEQPLMRGLKS